MYTSSAFRPDDDWSIQSKRRQSYFSELKLVTDNLSLFMQQPTEKPLKEYVLNPLSAQFNLLLNSFTLHYTGYLLQSYKLHVPCSHSNCDVRCTSFVKCSFLIGTRCIQVCQIYVCKGMWCVCDEENEMLDYPNTYA